MSALRAFISWVSREGFVDASPATRVKVPKAPKTIAPTFSDARLRRLLSVIDRSKPIGFRDHCMVLTLSDTGVRLWELAGLQVPDLDLEDGYFQVMGKGAKERRGRIGAGLQMAL
ncbi:MAG: tyrosine-type recombinase/integrase [Anaerolineae bacterium]|nr:tyrosine-type recombinase/integrase [Anaerolineae bacterium]NIN96874.1 tyrosine-type recombinase/integrase [Anaerolineae bacterium]NIQ79853.1 tyrosine-type recombinase/integrase [Anaerolineae bacterium]